ncbi:acyltransferase family protein [Hymenobacter rubidus]|uniref:acyltransferase family protein n=1 Tax=Hymenobacter rubidus TaxID=1441626 RepID=UPI00191FFA68|nr:acyltransferase [Hymenobacter rubidus]
MSDSEKNSLQINHLRYLDGFRAIAALYVVIHHASHYFGLKAEATMPYHIFYMVSSKGHYAVDIFIVISGFCLALPVVKNGGIMRENSYWDFVKRRAKRILPTYYIAIIFSLLIASLFAIGGEVPVRLESFTSVTSRDLLIHLFLLQDVFLDTAGSINHAFWSISVEWRIYFLFPAIIWSIRSYGLITTMIFAAIFSSLFLFLLKKNAEFYLGITGISPHYLLLFGTGVIGAQISYSSLKNINNFRNNTSWRSLIAGLVLFTLIADWRTEWEPFENWLLGTNFVFLDILIGLCTSCLLINFSIGNFRLLMKILSSQVISKIGIFAYSIYLVHVPILEIFYLIVITRLKLSPFYQLVIMDSLGLLVVIIASYVFFLIAEKPFMRKHKIIAMT